MRELINYKLLTLSIPIPDEDKKLSEIFIFTLLCGASNGFMKIKIVKIKIGLFISIQLSEIHVTGMVKMNTPPCLNV